MMNIEFEIDNVSNEPLTAEEMFSVYDFKKMITGCNNSIIYGRSGYKINSNNTNVFFTETICFKDGYFMCYSTLPNGMKIDGNLLMAISKQMEELKWA